MMGSMFLGQIVQDMEKILSQDDTEEDPDTTSPTKKIKLEEVPIIYDLTQTTDEESESEDDDEAWESSVAVSGDLYGDLDELDTDDLSVGLVYEELWNKDGKFDPFSEELDSYSLN